MTRENGGPTGDVGQYAMEQYREQAGGGLTSLLTMGMSDIVAATRAVAAASEAQALSVDPHAIDSMLRKLTEMQDALDKIQRQSIQLRNRTPLGGGYAEEIGALNGRLGEQVIGEIIPQMTKAIDDLKLQIEKSRASYENIDEAKAETLNKR